MSLVVRKERARNGMIADPGPLNENNNEFAGEFNGYMQRDNIPLNGVTAPMIEVGTFSRVIPDTQTGTITLDSASQDWQEIQSISDTVTADCMLDIEWSGGLMVTSRGDGRDGICFRFSVNGVEIASTGWMAESYEWASVALSGACAVQAGPIEVRVDAMIANVSHDIKSPGLFAYVRGVDSDYDITERELVVIVENC